MKKKILIFALIATLILAVVSEAVILRCFMSGHSHMNVLFPVGLSVSLATSLIAIIIFFRYCALEKKDYEKSIENIRQQEKLYTENIKRINKENQQKTEKFRALLSHSLRMPVAVIQGYAELLVNDMVSDEEVKKDYLNKIVQRSQYMSDIISRSLNSEENIEIQDLNYEVVDLLELIRHVAADMKKAAESKGIVIRVLSPDEEIIATVDSYLITRVMFNLLENAVKYMGRSGTVTIRVMNNDGQVNISVRDDGMGLCEEETRHIFEYQFKGSNHVSGSGYGMYLVEKSITAHGGEVSAQSSLGGGMGITMTIPVKPSQEAELHI